MERFSFGAEAAFVPRGGAVLEDVTVAPLTQPIALGGSVQAAVFRLAPGGRIPRHPATHPQILAVLAGSGEVSGAEGIVEPIEADEAVFWQAGEEHEAKASTGMTALILDGEGLEPFRRPA